MSIPMIRFCITAILLLVATAPAWSDELTTLAGKTQPGTLQRITDTEIVFDTGTTQLSQALLLKLRESRTLPEAETYIEVQLADESLLRCTKIVFGVKD